MRTIIIWSITLLLFNNITIAQEKNNNNPAGNKKLENGKQDTESNNSKKNIEKNKWGIAPIAMPAYAPETKLAFGGGVIYYNNPYPERVGVKPDQITAYGEITQQKQAIAGFNTERYYDVNNFKLFLEMEYSNWPSQFWGIGSDNGDEMKEDYKNIDFSTEGSFMYRIFRNLYFGPYYKYYHSEIKDKEKNGLLAGENIRGSEGTNESGIGFHMCMDTTDISFYPHRGILLEIQNLNYSKSLNGNNSFTQVEINGRHYFRIKGEHVLAFQYIAQFSFGEPPFQMLHYCDIRGYNTNRFIDKQYIGGNIEYRYPLFWRIGGTVFAGAGEIAPQISSFDNKSIKTAAGAGLRITLEKSEHINLRFDVGFTGLKNCEFYVDLGEVF